MELISSASKNGLLASSFSAKNVSDIIFNDYDVLILTSSWDGRSTTLTKSKIDRVSNVILMLFDDKDDNGIRDKNDEFLIKYAESISDKQYVINGLSTDVDCIWKKLFNYLILISNQYSRALKILYDFSCSPPYYSLTLLSTCFKYGIASVIDYFYNECTYPEKSDSLSLEEVAFTAGRWEAKNIEHMTGKVNPGSKNRFTVSIGFEGSKTLMILNEFEPDKVNVIIPCPGYSDQYVDRVRSANFELFKSFGVRDANEILSNAGDPVELWCKLSEKFKYEEEWNEYFLCAGSKPHSLGLALASLTLDFPSLIYSLPQKHNFINVQPTSNCWLYTVNNIIVPTITNV